MTQNTGTTELHGGLEKMENHQSLDFIQLVWVEEK